MYNTKGKMDMQLQISLTNPSMKINAALLRDLADRLEGKQITSRQLELPLDEDGEGTSKTDIQDIKTKARKGSKKPENDEESLMDLGDTDVEESHEDEDEDADDQEMVTSSKNTKGKAPKNITLEDIISAFQMFAKKNSREKAGKILNKYGVKSVRDLPENKYSEIMKILGA